MLNLTGYEKVICAIRNGLSEGHPVMLPFTDIMLRDHYREITDIARSNGKEFIDLAEELYEYLDVDGVDCILGSEKGNFVRKIRLRDDGEYLTADKGEARIKVPEIGGSHMKVGPKNVTQREEMEENKVVHSSDKLITKGHYDLHKATAQRYKGKRFIGTGIASPFWGCIDHLGFDKAMIKMVEEPQTIYKICEKSTIAQEPHIKALADFGVDGVCLVASLSSSDMISRKDYLRFEAPFIKHLIDEIRRHNMISIYYFPGDPGDRLRDIVEIKPDAIALEESKKGFDVDLDQVNGIVDGRCAIFGNLDAVGILQNGDADELKYEVQRQMDVGKRCKRFVMSVGSPVTPLTPITRVKKFMELARGMC